jgi:hypothetical protein
MTRNRRTLRDAALALLMPMLAGGCNTDPAIEATAVLNHDQCQGLEAGVTLVDRDAVAAIRERNLLGTSDGNRVPDGDLLMVAISRGEQPTAGYGFGLDGVHREPGTAVIDVTWTMPAPDAMVAQVITHPCLVVGIAESDIDGLGRIEARDQYGTVIGSISR